MYSATTTALNGFEDKKPNVNALVKKNNAKILDIEKKYFTTFEYVYE